jgi:hypothetical protein
VTRFLESLQQDLVEALVTGVPLAFPDVDDPAAVVFEDEEQVLNGA